MVKTEFRNLIISNGKYPAGILLSEVQPADHDELKLLYPKWYNDEKAAPAQAVATPATGTKSKDLK